MKENEQGLIEQQYANWQAPSSDSEKTEIDRLVAERMEQDYSSRLCEYLTGMKPEDPRMVDRIAEDKKIIRAKYHLPNPDMPVTEYERALMQMVKDFNVKVKPKSDCGKYFEENPFSGAVYMGEGKIGVDVNRSDLGRYWRGLAELEHELVHAIQDLKTPGMPIELMEYEAYVSGANVNFLRRNPDGVKNVFFDFFMQGSVRSYYKQLSEQREEETKPLWDNPEYFLRRDGIDPDKISKEIKQENSE